METLESLGCPGLFTKNKIRFYIFLSLGSMIYTTLSLKIFYIYQARAALDAMKLFISYFIADSFGTNISAFFIKKLIRTRTAFMIGLGLNFVAYIGLAFFRLLELQQLQACIFLISIGNGFIYNIACLFSISSESDKTNVNKISLLNAYVFKIAGMVGSLTLGKILNLQDITILWPIMQIAAVLSIAPLIRDMTVIDTTPLKSNFFGVTLLMIGLGSGICLLIHNIFYAHLIIICLINYVLFRRKADVIFFIYVFFNVYILKQMPFIVPLLIGYFILNISLLALNSRQSELHQKALDQNYSKPLQTDRGILWILRTTICVFFLAQKTMLITYMKTYQPILVFGYTINPVTMNQAAFGISYIVMMPLIYYVRFRILQEKSGDLDQEDRRYSTYQISHLMLIGTAFLWIYIMHVYFPGHVGTTMVCYYILEAGANLLLIPNVVAAINHYFDSKFISLAYGAYSLSLAMIQCLIRDLIYPFVISSKLGSGALVIYFAFLGIFSFGIAGCYHIFLLTPKSQPTFISK